MLSLYLDTSDLSALLKGRVPVLQGRLEAMMQRGDVMLLVSQEHVFEIAQDAHTSRCARAWFERGFPVWMFSTLSSEIFRAELMGEPLEVHARPWDGRSLSTLKHPLLNGHAARVLKLILRLRAWADNRGKKAMRRSPEVPANLHRAKLKANEAVVRGLLSGDASMLPTWAQPIVRTGTSRLLRMVGRRGLDSAALRQQVDLKAEGLSWFAGLIAPDAWAAAKERCADAASAPASAMRVAIVRHELRALTKASTEPDLMHVAYAVQCDVATIDGENMKATKSVRPKLTKTTFFGTGKLESVLDFIDSRGAEPA